MKKIFVFVFLATSFPTFANSGKSTVPNYPPDSTTVTQILALNLASYIGKPVDSLLSVLPCGYSSRNFMPVRIGKIRGLSQSYFAAVDNNCAVEIYIDTFNFLPIPNITSLDNWDMSLVKKETIAFIKVYKNNYTCVYGCNNANYYYP